MADFCRVNTLIIWVIRKLGNVVSWVFWLESCVLPKVCLQIQSSWYWCRNGVLRAVRKWFSVSRLLWCQSFLSYSSVKEHSSRMPSWKQRATSSRPATCRCLILNFLAFMFWEINFSCTYTTQCQVLCNCSTNKTNTPLVRFPLLGDNNQTHAIWEREGLIWLTVVGYSPSWRGSAGAWGSWSYWISSQKTGRLLQS